MFLDRLNDLETVRRIGRVRTLTASCVEGDGPPAPLGALCRISPPDEKKSSAVSAFAEIVGVREDSVILAPLGPLGALSVGARIETISQTRIAKVGDAFLGRAVDGMAAPIDGGAEIQHAASWPLDGVPLTPLDRTTTGRVFETGVKVIDGLFTLGVGQRVGIFSAAGVGKSTLVSQIALQSACDHCVICLVGERGREIEATWSKIESAGRRASTALVAASSDQSPALRVRAVHQAVSLAEYWRAKGSHVLLVLDSVTRLAMALREIGLSAGEPPTIRAYTPSTFAALPRLVERCGAARVGGAITAVMTVLAESDEVEDPISETLRSLLDGHIVLSRHLSDQNCFPAVDAPRSLSRLAIDLVDSAHKDAAARVSKLISTYDSSRTLIEAGVYARGSSKEIDEAIDLRPAVLDFLQQGAGERYDLPRTLSALKAVAGARA
jgi:flagellum-specific ATP synthase